jgi:hypothetical protein
MTPIPIPPLAASEHPVFDPALHQRVRRLHARHRRDAMEPLELVRIAARHTDVTGLALALERRHRLPGLLDRTGIGARPAIRQDGRAQLVEIEAVDAEPPEAGFGLAPDRIGPEAV